MKKAALLILLCIFLSSCANSDIIGNTEDKITVVCTNFAAYDWVRNIIGDSKDETLILMPSNGTDIHSYQPTTGDAAALSECDFIIYSSANENNWYKKMVSASAETLNMVDVCDEMNSDEHIWMSLEKTAEICERIKDGLSALNPSKAENYNRNFIAYEEKIKALDKVYSDELKNAEKDTVIVPDRFPYYHLFKDYKIRYHSAFEGCSAESEMSFETVTHLRKEISDINAKCVIVTETPNNDILTAVTSGLDVKILTLNAMQSVTEADTHRIDYLSVMEDNLLVLKEALN